MRDRLFSLLKVESGEEYMVSMLLTQSVFLGIFFGAFDISAHSLFLAIFDEKMLAKGYVVSGIAGIILTYLYTWFQTRIRNFGFINLSFITLVTLCLWLVMILNPARWVIFLVFVMLGPLNILAMLGYRATADRLFTPRQGERLFRLVDTGLIIGIIVSCFTIPILLLLKFQVHNILLLSAFAGIVSAILQKMVSDRFRKVSVSNNHLQGKPGQRSSVFTVLIEDPYSRIISIFLALSVVTLFFIQYSFMAVTRSQYPSGKDMAMFLGIFTGSMLIITLFFKSYLFLYILKKYGLRACLAFSPVILVIVTGIVIGAGMVIGYTPGSTSGFLIFFLLLALSRLFSKSLKDTIEFPSFKVIYQTVEEKIKYELKSARVGTLNEIAVLISGLILTGLGTLSFIKLIHFSWILLLIILVWLFAAYRLYKEYRKSISKALDKAGSGSITSGGLNEQVVFKNRFSAYRSFRIDYFSLISGDFSALEKKENRFYYEKIIDYSISKQDINLIPVLKKLAAKNVYEDIRRQSEDLVRNMEVLAARGKKENEKVISAGKILSGTRTPQTTEILRLLRDNTVESKRLAIYLIGKFELSDMLPEVCECLNIPELETDAYSVLRAFGSKAENELIRFYLVSSGNPNISKTILRLLGESCTKGSTGFLFSRIWSNSRQLKEIALKCLIDCGFKPSEEEKIRLNQFISDIIGIMTWNLSARQCLEKSDNTYLPGVMKKEIERWNRFLIDILSVTYNSGHISRIREGFEGETFESINCALEMINIVIDDSIKTKLIYLLDAVPDDEKLQNLNQFFPGDVPLYSKLLDDIINRDYNLLSIWTKACVLRYLQGIEGDDMRESVIALLFSPEDILQEEAAKLIARSNVELYRSVSHRIPETARRHLDMIVNGEIHRNEFLFDKILFLSGVFPGIYEEELVSLAEEMEHIRDLKTKLSSLPDGYILWTVSSDRKDTETHIFYHDKIADREGKVYIKSDVSYYVLSLKAVEGFLYKFPDRSPEIFRYLDDNEE